MDEPESLDSEMTELQGCSSEALEALSQDDEDEVEELQNSLREVVQDPCVKPKLQCLMVDPSFSMVTVQSEDSGIVWETASSRCSTPWASETSSASEGGSVDGSGSAGKITIIFDEEKVVRRRTRSGRSSRLSDRFSRHGSSRSASALGVERVEMMEVSQPNVNQDKTDAEQDLEEIKNKDQQLFSLISEGYEILNIRVPSKLPTVDEEESTELQDNLFFLDQTPKIKSRNHHQWTPDEEEDLQNAESQNEESKEASTDPPAHSDLKPAPTEGPGDIDYFEKFTLLDVVTPEEQAAEEQDECATPVPPPEPEQTTAKDTDRNISPAALEESFVFVSDDDIVGEHLDEVFYGEGPPADLVQKTDEDNASMRIRRQSSIKESGSVLFEREETVLTPIYISSGPPKIIDPILLEEPTAMSFMYADLYEEAVGERGRSDEENSESESVKSEKSHKRRLTDYCEEMESGYLEKFILRDETPNVVVPSEVVDDRKGGRMMWLHNEFEMSGCLTRQQTEISKPETETQKSTEVVLEAEILEIPKQDKVIEQSTSEVLLPTDQMEITDDILAAATDTPAPATDIPLTVIQGEETQASETIEDAVIVDTGLEIPKEAYMDSSLEVSTDCEPPVQAHVEVIEMGKTDTKTQVCIDLQEVKLATTAMESTSTVEDLGQGGDAEIEQVEKQAEMIKQDASSEVGPEIKAGVVKENVDGELLLLVPKGQAVEMDIEISPKPDQEAEQAEDNVEPIEPEMQKDSASRFEDTTGIAKEDVRLPEEESKGTEQEKDLEKSVSILPSNIPQKDESITGQEAIDTQKPEVKEDVHSTVDETPLATDIDISPQPDQGLEQTEDSIKPKVETLMQQEMEIVSKIEEKSTAAIEDVHLPEEESKETEQEKELEKQQIVSIVASDIPQKDESITGQEVIIDTQKPEVKEKEKEDDHSSVNETSLATDIEISPQPDQGLEQTEDSIKPKEETLMEQEMEIVSKIEEKTTAAIEDVHLPEEESKETEQEKELEKQQIVASDIQQKDESITDQEVIIDTQKPEVKEDVHSTVNETSLATDIEISPQPDQGLEQTEDNLKPQDIEIESKIEEKTTVAKENVHVPEEESMEAEQTKDLEKQQLVVLSNIPQQDEPVTVEKSIMDTQMPEVEEQAKTDVSVDETPLCMDESHKAKQKTNTEKTICITPQEILAIAPETTTQIQKVPELQEKEDEIILTDVKDIKDVTTVVIEEYNKAEPKIDEAVSEMDTVPTVEEETEIASDHVDLSPASVDEGQNVASQRLSIPETTKQYRSIPLNEAQTEELVHEVVNTDKDTQALEAEQPKQALEQHIEVIHKELEVDNEEAAVEGQTLEGNLEEVTNAQSTLKRFTPLQDLSGLDAGDVNLETAVSETMDQDQQINISEDAQDVTQDTEKKVSPDITMDYEIITEEDAKEMARVEIEDEKVESVKEDEYMEEMLEDTADLEEVDYETIDAEEERQARLAAELQGLDWYCVTCGSLLSEQESSSEPHQGHEVTAVDQAYESIMEKLSDWISELQGKSENIEDLVSELELAYNSVEDQCHESEAEIQAQNEEMMALLMEQYNSMSMNMEEEKKAKLEQLYDQIVSFQESIDAAKGTLETSDREAETNARSAEDIHARLTAALESAMSLELGPRGLLVFEDYAKGNNSGSQFTERKGIAVPQRPSLQLQVPGSASSSSVTVYWKVNPEDVIDCFQVYCMEDPQGAISEEYRVTVKESYCVLEELEPDKTYKVWVMAVNYTGCSLPSARLVFKTAPSVPVIDTERCSVTWDTAILRWSSGEQTPGLSYTLEYCRQYELEGEGLRTISGIKNLEHKVLLQPNENYLFYIKAVSEAGSSEQSEAALISTKGTKFQLLKATAHPALELSVDQTTLHYSQDVHDNMSDEACPFILGEQLPLRGQYYWECDVSRCTHYRVGVAYSSDIGGSSLGESQLSWCLQCTPTQSGCSFHLLHNDIHTSLCVIDLPGCVGIFLDYQFDHLSFYNAQSGQLLGSFSERFTQPCHSALGLDAPGSVEVCMVQEVPEFTKNSSL